MGIDEFNTFLKEIKEDNSGFIINAPYLVIKQKNRKRCDAN